MRPLDHYATLHHTDKRSDMHNFAEFYERKIGHLRSQPIKLLEFGVKHGQSIRMWEDAFPMATIDCVDIAPEWKVKPERARFTKLDLSNRKGLWEYCKKNGPWDVVVDDSAHTNAVTQNIIEMLWPNYIRRGGWLFIEDINSGFKTTDTGKIKYRFGQIDYCQTMVKNVCHSGELHYCGPKHWKRSSNFDKAIKELVYAPGIMGMERR